MEEAECQSQNASSGNIHRSREISLYELSGTLRRGRWTIAICTVVMTVGAAAVALLMTPVYRGEVLLAPQAEGGIAPRVDVQLGALASLSGVSLNKGPDETSQAIALIRSRMFVEGFILEQELMPILFDEMWNSENESWTVEAEERPTIRKAVRRFQEMVTIEEDVATGLVSLAVEWKSPELAAQWANKLVSRLNGLMRDRAIAEAETSIRYLQTEADKTNVVELKQAMYGLIERQIKTVMLANVRDQYAFRVLDPAVVAEPDERVRPQRPVMVVAGTTLGIVLGIFIVLLKNALSVGRQHYEGTTRIGDPR